MNYYCSALRASSSAAAATVSAAAVAVATSSPTTTVVCRRYLSLSLSLSTATASRSFSTTPVRPRRKESHDTKSHPRGHGEQIWVWTHIEEGRIIYSLEPLLKPIKAFEQVPFTGKKLVPAKLRKDYWRPMALIDFKYNPEAAAKPPSIGKDTMGLVGRSVYQKLRELKLRHDLEWDDERLIQMKKHDRGVELNDQRGNSVADISAVLGGIGKGNKMWYYPVPEKPKKEKPKKEASITKKKAAALDDAAAAGEAGSEPVAKQDAVAAAEVEEAVEAAEAEVEASPKASAVVETVTPEEERVLQIHRATIYWANEEDRHWAAEWPENVTHVVGPLRLPGHRLKMHERQAALELA
ncbi:transcriptional regulation of mitochondrial recombination-domain-containing protein [Lasiosphaeria ovina]|uniref:Large ribosomal subunit protein mL67 n=1 Tax=Lasiosphaeria ovina TaxID=92902 RepID=A0AAE0K3V8_9PEZI|nr:transcriptional regulation of mitochondrial recombination-domain-containing protein [Lasiosphaeria ovina]